MKHKIMNASEMGKKSQLVQKEKYPNHEPQSLGGKRGAATKLRNDPDYFKKIRAIGVAKKKAQEKAAKSQVNQLANILIGGK
jgi:hypothetical protein